MTTTRDTTWTHSRPACFPSQPNFMTNVIHGYRSCSVDGRAAWCELSSGDGIFGGTLWGVTVRLSNQLAPDKIAVESKHSKVFHSRAEAEEHADNLN